MPAVLRLPQVVTSHSARNQTLADSSLPMRQGHLMQAFGKRTRGLHEQALRQNGRRRSLANTSRRSHTWPPPWLGWLESQTEGCSKFFILFLAGVSVRSVTGCWCGNWVCLEIPGNYLKVKVGNEYNVNGRVTCGVLQEPVVVPLLVSVYIRKWAKMVVLSHFNFSDNVDVFVDGIGVGEET